MAFQRLQINELRNRFAAVSRFITIVAGPRQVGKTTLVRTALDGIVHEFIAVDQYEEPLRPFGNYAQTSSEPTGENRDAGWLIRSWQAARERQKQIRATNSEQAFALVFDEIQKIPRWSEVVKGLWDADRAAGMDMHVVLLGSSPLLMQKGLTESLMGRYELIPVTHWSFPEMHEAFDFTLNEYFFFGGYPGNAPLIRDEERWRQYVLASVDKPALLKQLFTLGSSYSGPILALGKVKGQLDGAGNETTLAGYLDLLGNAGLLTGLHKYHRGVARQRASPPKFNVLNTALMSSATPYTFAEAQADRSFWGRLVESAVGAHLCNTAKNTEKVHYWRESPHEVDFVISDANRLTAIEVKSGTHQGKLNGLDAFSDQHKDCHRLLVGAGGVDLTEFLSYPLSHWLAKP